MQLWNNSQCCYVGHFSKGMSHLPVTYFQVSHLGDFHSSHPGPRESVLFFSYLRWNTRITFLYSDFETGLEARKPAFLFAPACLNFLFFFFHFPLLLLLWPMGVGQNQPFGIEMLIRSRRDCYSGDCWQRLLTKRRIINHHLAEIPSSNAISRTHTPLSLSADRPCWYIRVCWPFCWR